MATRALSSTRRLTSNTVAKEWSSDGPSYQVVTYKVLASNVVEMVEAFGISASTSGSNTSPHL